MTIPGLKSRAPFQQRALFFAAALLGPWLIRLLGATCRYRVIGMERLTTVERGGKGAILALWHGRMLLPVYHLRGRSICALISLHRDGELIARIVQRLGYITRRGSPKEGGREGFAAMLRDLKAGRTIAIFPDGPTGPRHSVRDGVVHLARLSGLPVIPMSFSSRRAWRAGSWDRFTVMKPFSEAVILIGEPLTLPRRIESEIELARQRERIREALCAVELEADGHMGYSSEADS